MNRLLPAVLIAAATALSIVSSAFPQAGHATIALPCNTTSFDEFEYSSFAEVIVPDPTESLLLALEMCMDGLVHQSKVKCGPCNIPGSCKAVPSNLDGAVATTGPTETPEGDWRTTASFAYNTYQITCSPCDN